MMSKESYSREIQNSTNKEIGILLSRAIKDPQLTPDAYNQLCKEAKLKGFSFRFNRIYKINMENEKIIGSVELQKIADFKLRGRGLDNTTLIIQNILALYRMKLKFDVFVYIIEEDSNYSSM